MRVLLFRRGVPVQGRLRSCYNYALVTFTLWGNIQDRLRGGWTMNRNGLRGVASALISLLGVTAGFAAGTVEVASQVDPSRVSAPGSGTRPAAPFDPLPIPPSLSADGRYAVFLSAMTNLVPGQQEGNGGPQEPGRDVFLADLTAGTVTLMSHAMSSPATTGNKGSLEAVLSADGRWVAFISSATDLVPGQAGNPYYPDSDVLLFDRVSGATTLVASTREDLSGFENLSISADGRYVVFESDASDIIPGQQGERGGNNVFLYDRVERTTRLVSHVSGSPTTGGGGSQRGISADGRFILLAGGANLSPGLPATTALVLYDRVADTLAPVGSAPTAVLSADGKIVAYVGGTSLYFYARETGVTTQVEVSGTTTAGSSSPPLSLSADGHFAAFLLSDPPGGYGARLAVCDRISRTTVMEGRPVPQYGPSIDAFRISADGRLVVFAASAADAVPGQVDANTEDAVFVFDRTTGRTSLVSGAGGSPLTTGNGASGSPVLSANGARAVFWSRAADLVAGLKDLNGTADLFAYDVAAKSAQAVTRRAADLPSLSPALGGEAGDLSADGRLVAFVSASSHLVPGQVDTNGKEDVFLYDRTTRTVLLVSRTRASAVTAAAGRSLPPAVSADGRYVAFSSDA